LRWLARNEEFRTQYARSKEESAEALAEQYFDILDELPPAKADGSLDSAAVMWAKNRERAQVVSVQDHAEEVRRQGSDRAQWQNQPWRLDGGRH
jgi:hypothetical protein